MLRMVFRLSWLGLSKAANGCLKLPLPEYGGAFDQGRSEFRIFSLPRRKSLHSGLSRKSFIVIFTVIFISLDVSPS